MDGVCAWIHEKPTVSELLGFPEMNHTSSSLNNAHSKHFLARCGRLFFVARSAAAGFSAFRVSACVVSNHCRGGRNVLYFLKKPRAASLAAYLMEDMDMKKELEHFQVGRAYGGSQAWYHDRWMRMGGCAAVTACDCAIYFDLYKGTHLYPYGLVHIQKREYLRFGIEMRPYLRPRWSGIDTLEIFMDGFGGFLSDRGVSAGMEPLHGERPFADAADALRAQIDGGLPVPCLILRHQNPAFRDYDWHWFLLNGYDVLNDRLLVKAVTYGGWRWLDFAGLWDTGNARRGGLVLYRF